MEVRTEWWGVVIYAFDDEEVTLLKEIYGRTGNQATQFYEDGDIKLLYPGDDEWEPNKWCYSVPAKCCLTFGR